ncbi:putative NLR family CARD domain-containing protein 4, partial [Apostichopus japonicus]
NVPLMDNYAKKRLFVNQLKTKYEQIYEDVKPIPFLEDMCSVEEVFILGAIEVLEKETHGKKWKPLQHYHQLVKLKLDSGRHIIEGEPGCGKSTLVIQYLYEWCKGDYMSLRRDIDILIFLPLRQLTGLDSIFKAIKQFILPKHSTISEDDVKNIINLSSSVHVILDGYDEYAEKDTKETFVSSLLTKDLLPDACVILTTRSSCLPKKYFPKTERIRLKGFNEEARDEYIRKVIVGDESSLETLKLKLRVNPILNYLCDIPLFFAMFAHITSERGDFRDVISATKFFRCIV